VIPVGILWAAADRSVRAYSPQSEGVQHCFFAIRPEATEASHSERVVSGRDGIPFWDRSRAHLGEWRTARRTFACLAGGVISRFWHYYFRTDERHIAFQLRVRGSQNLFGEDRTWACVPNRGLISRRSPPRTLHDVDCPVRSEELLFVQVEILGFVTGRSTPVPCPLEIWVRK
jgi:hypothetical protein